MSKGLIVFSFLVEPHRFQATWTVAYCRWKTRADKSQTNCWIRQRWIAKRNGETAFHAGRTDSTVLPCLSLAFPLILLETDTMKHIFALLAVMFISTAIGRADDKKTGFVDKVHKDSAGEHKYVVFIPHDYKGDKEFPVILFLHGSGETADGKNKKMPVEVGIGPAIKKREKTFPFITVIPQAEKRPWSTGSTDGKMAIAILDEVCSQYKTDKKRIYLTGLSMGGGGTWSHAAAMPDRWAAIVPICGPGDPGTAEKIKNIPCWGFVGDKDSDRIVNGMKGMIDALKKSGAEPKYTVYPGVGHNSWDMAYDTEDLYVWLAKQSKK